MECCDDVHRHDGNRFYVVNVEVWSMSRNDLMEDSAIDALSIQS
jgi:hypothetical protein